jgi:hypothetical protein
MSRDKAVAATLRAISAQLALLRVMVTPEPAPQQAALPFAESAVPAKPARQPSSKRYARWHTPIAFEPGEPMPQDEAIRLLGITRYALRRHALAGRIPKPTLIDDRLHYDSGAIRALAKVAK